MVNVASKVTIHMVSSLDGFIAKKDGDVSWMHTTDHYDKGITLSEEHIAEVLEYIDCYVMGSNTFEDAMELGWPYGEKPCIVLTRRKLVTDKENVEFYSGDLDKLIHNLKHKYENIWMVGGSVLTKELLQMKLADEIIITLIPVILGDGLLFFDYLGFEQKLQLKDVMTYKDGMVEIRYEIK